MRRTAFKPLWMGRILASYDKCGAEKLTQVHRTFNNIPVQDLPLFSSEHELTYQSQDQEVRDPCQHKEKVFEFATLLARIRADSGQKSGRKRQLQTQGREAAEVCPACGPKGRSGEQAE